MKEAGWLLTTVFAAMVHTSWPDILTVRDEVQPDFLLLTVVFFGLSDGEERAMLTGLLAGIYADTITGSTLGYHVLCLVLAGYFAGRISTRLVTEHPAVKVGLVFVCGLLYGLVALLVTFVQQPTENVTYLFFATAVPIAFYSALLTPFVFGLLGALFRPRPLSSRSHA